jgi:Cu(I)/Ag(I) efflux system membrane protein CusA/SilA
MAVVTTFIALVPILWSSGAGADVMRRIAAPMVGGLFTSFLGELIVFPAIYFVWRGVGLERTPLFQTDDEASETPAVKTG